MTHSPKQLPNVQALELVTPHKITIFGYPNGWKTPPDLTIDQCTLDHKRFVEGHVVHRVTSLGLNQKIMTIWSTGQQRRQVKNDVTYLILAYTHPDWMENWHIVQHKTLKTKATTYLDKHFSVDLRPILQSPRCTPIRHPWTPSHKANTWTHGFGVAVGWEPKTPKWKGCFFSAKRFEASFYINMLRKERQNNNISTP